MCDAKSNAVYMERIDALATAKAGPLKHVVGKVNKRHWCVRVGEVFIVSFLFLVAKDT